MEDNAINNGQKPKKEKNISPIYTLLSLITVCLLLCIIMFFFPKDGIKIGRSTLQFPSISDFFLPKIEEDSLSKVKKDLALLFDSNVVVSQIDSAIIQHRLDSLKNFRQSIQINAKGKVSINNFFAELENANNKKVRIMHYGDSQIEADRITSVLRNELQNKFGGYGVGLFDIIQVAPKMSVNIEYSENWKRYAGFGIQDTAVTHKKYGALMAFCRYAPMPKSTILSDSLNYEAWVKLKKPRASYGRTRTHTVMKVFLSNSHANINYTITADGVQVKAGVIPPNTPYQSLNVNFTSTPEEIVLSFKGKDSPDIYGISLEGSNGVVMDNIPLRGSSGTIFTKQDATLLSNMYASLSPSLIIMEFGGNNVPHVTSEKGCKDYGNWFLSQINFMKRLNPNAAIIVIGPGDMSVKEGTEYVTYPYLEGIRDAMKEAALSSGSLFWDMYEAMGGKNSMPKWVAAEPSLAASDYIHFSPKGAKKMADEFTTKLFDLYKLYKDPNYKKTDSIIHIETKKNEEVSNDSIQ